MNPPVLRSSNIPLEITGFSESHHRYAFMTFRSVITFIGYHHIDCS